MLKIFDSKNYKEIFQLRLSHAFPKKAGALSQLSKIYRIPNSTLSQVFHGERHLTPEQACDVADFLKLNPVESEYFCLLVDLERAGTDRLKKQLENKIADLVSENQKLKNILTHNRVISSAEKFQFYSSWEYSAIHLLTALSQVRKISDISQYLDIPQERVAKILDFLVETKMIDRKDEKFSPGKTSTFIPNEDSLVFRHHQNWRAVALNRHSHSPQLGNHELALTLPCATTKGAMKKIKAKLLELSEEVNEIVTNHGEETVGFLLIDLMEMKKKNN